MYTIKNLLIFFIFCTIFLNSKAQINQKSTDGSFKLEIKPIVNVNSKYDTLYQIVCSFDIKDTIITDKIKFSVGSLIDKSDILNFNFNIKLKNNLPVGVFYLRHKQKVLITLGQFLYADFFYSVKFLNAKNATLKELNFHNEN
jgi:hypothetical protein